MYRFALKTFSENSINSYLLVMNIILIEKREPLISHKLFAKTKKKKKTKINKLRENEKRGNYIL